MSAWLLLGLATAAAPLAIGCSGAAPTVAMVKAEGEVASLSYALRLAPGDGTMTKMTGEAVRNALIAAGFRLADQKSADVILEVTLSDIEKKSFIVMTVNGKQQQSRAVTAEMRAISADGKTIDQHVEKFTVTQDEEVEEKRLAPLINHFAKSAELERYSLEVQIERVKGGGTPNEPRDDDADGDAPQTNKVKGEGSGKEKGSTEHGVATLSNGEPGAKAPEGRLPKDAIARVVRAASGRFRMCYEAGLQKDATLTGTVQVSFAIGVDGRVASAQRLPGTTLPDDSVVSCITKAFRTLEFPKPEGGIVKATYPFQFAPG